METFETVISVRAGLDDFDNLAKFVGLMKKFNKNLPMSQDLKSKIERFFEYKWNYDKNQAIDDEGEKAILDQLPVEVQDKLFTGFLFSEFLDLFQRFFLIEKGVARVSMFQTRSCVYK